MAAWATGTQLGPYVLLAQLGAGGMGEVWKARDTRLNRIVAVKRLKSKQTPRFEQEARAIAALNHPNMARFTTSGPFRAGPGRVWSLFGYPGVRGRFRLAIAREPVPSFVPTGPALRRNLNLPEN